MPLGPYMLGCVVRVIGDVEHASGKPHRGALGTAFCVQVESEKHPGRWYTYVVSAHHVVDAQPRPELLIPDSRQPGTLHPTVTTSGPDWVQPIEEVDLAVLPFQRPEGAWINTLRVGYQLYEALPEQALLGMPFFYTGLLAPLNRAMARSGTLGAVYQTGIRHPDGYEYVAHLGDCRTYGGFSGSPCFLELSMAKLTPTEPFVEPPPQVGPLGSIQYLHLLCGMVTWHLEPGGDHQEASLYGVVAMVTSDEIFRCLMSPKLREMRSEQDNDAAAGSGDGFLLSHEHGAWERFSEGE